MNRVVLLLTTRGRKSGLARVTPLQYEEVDGIFYVGSARGAQADWYRNILACPQVEMQIGTRIVEARAEPVADVGHIADFLELRLKRHPRMVGAMMLMEGLAVRPNRAALEHYASRITMVEIHPVESAVSWA